MVYLFIRNLPCNTKRKAKKLCFYVTFTFVISYPLNSCFAIGVSATPEIYKLHSIDDNIIYTNKNYLWIIPIAKPKIDKVKFTSQQIEQFYIINKQLSCGLITLEEAILQLCGGGDLTNVIAIIAFVIFINWYDSLFGIDAF